MAHQQVIALSRVRDHCCFYLLICVFPCIQLLHWELGWHNRCNREGGERDSKMTILSLLNLFLQFWSAIWSVSESVQPQLPVLTLSSSSLYILQFCVRDSPRILHSSGWFVLGGSCVRTIRLGDGATHFPLIMFSFTVPDDSISLISYWSLSLSLINANLLGSTSEVKSELARGFLELFNRS